MRSLLLSTEQWPLVITTMHDGVTDADYEAYFAEFEARVLSRGSHFASLVDASRLTEPPTAAQRKKIADWQEAELERGTQFNVCVAMVLTNRIVRGALTALHWVFPPPTPTTAISTYDEAHAWCLSRLERAGVPIAHLEPGRPA
ncbi:MAG: hypothetical protein H5U40_13590, partial [Polyangiaceae bacterium]|nr:hypothetical protein [Polyangiaceae bacterium]